METPYLQLPNYQLEEIIGQGGMGVVYLGRHKQIDRKVAIKVLNPTYSNQASFRERFQNEAEVLSKLKHPNIVVLYEYVQLPQTVCLIMEHVEGMPLDEYISKVSGPIPEKRVLPIFRKIIDGLGFAHQQGIIHRDIKPANIMITNNLEVKVLDFGIAKALGNTQSKLTQVGMRMGTMMYMSPEQLREQSIGFKSDMYSLGVTFFEMLTGQSPYHEEVSEYELIHKIVHEPLPRMSSFYPNISDRLQNVIDKATAKLPEKRFSSLNEFWQALNGEIEVSRSKTPPVVKKEDNIIEWTIKSEEKNKQFNPKENKESKKNEESLVEEIIYLESFFGKITNFQIEYFKGKDLFEKGSSEILEWEYLDKIELKVHREWLTGLVVILASFLLFFWLEGFLAWFILIVGALLTWVCFAPYPSILIYKIRHKKVTMRGWPWQYNAAQTYVKAIQEVLEQQYVGF